MGLRGYISCVLSLLLAVQTPLWCCCASAGGGGGAGGVAGPEESRSVAAGGGSARGVEMPSCHAAVVMVESGGAVAPGVESRPCGEERGPYDDSPRPCDGGECNHPDRVLDAEPTGVLPFLTAGVPLPMATVSFVASMRVEVAGLKPRKATAAHVSMAPPRSLCAQHVLLTV